MNNLRYEVGRGKRTVEANLCASERKTRRGSGTIINMISSLIVDPYLRNRASRWPGYVSIKSRSIDRSIELPCSSQSRDHSLVLFPSLSISSVGNYVLMNFSLPI